MKKLYASLRLMAVALLFFLSAGANSQSNPVAVDDTASVIQHYNIEINVLKNDFDPDGDSLIISDIGLPVHGTASHYWLNDSIIKYSCDDYAGKDSLWYKITKKNNPQFEATAWIVIDVLPNELPVVYDEPHEIMVGDTLSFNIYDVAYDPDGNGFHLDDVDDPEHGEADESSGSTFWVTITENYMGMDSLEVKLREEITPSGWGLQNESYLKLDVSPNAEYPWANNDTMTVMRGDTAVFHVLENDTDQQNDQLIIDDADLEYFKPIIHYSDNETTVTIVPDVFADTGLVRYFEYQAVELENSLHLSNWASGYLQVLPNPNLPIATNDTVNAEAGFEVQIHPLANDTDINGDALKIGEVRTAYNNVILENNDSIVYLTPYAYAHGQVELIYRLEETGNAAHYDIGRIFLHITENQNPPVAVNDTIYMNAYDSISFSPVANDNLPVAGDVSIKDIKTGDLLDFAVSIEKDPADQSLIKVNLKANYSGELCFRYNFHYPDQPAMVSNYGEVCIIVAPDPDSLLAVGDFIETSFLFPVNGYNLFDNDQNPTQSTIEKIIYYADAGFNQFNIDSAGHFYLEPKELTFGEYRFYYYLFTDYSGNSPTPATFAQIKVSVENLHRIEALDINNINAGFSSLGFNFYDDESGEQPMKFEVPTGSGKRSVFSNALWIGGMHNDTLHLAATRFGNWYKDYWTGPISETYTNTDKQKYRVWKLNKSEIDYHITHYTDPGYEPIEAIATWPGNGNTTLGQAEQLAPYFDQNDDGVYDPLNGDFPLIRGDQSLFFIYNDGEQYHATGGMPLEIEIHGNAFAYDNPDDSTDFNTIFVHYDIYNRSENLYENTYVGFFNDFDLGVAWDDYIGSDVGRGVAYVYNGNPVDGAGERQAYGENPPVQGMVILRGTTMDSDNLDNPAGGCDESINGIHFGDGIVDNERMGMTGFSYFGGTQMHPHLNAPQIAIEYYNYLTGKWKDNSPLLYGGTGHISNPETVGPECRFSYPGASDPLNWGTNCEFPNGGFNQNGYYWDEVTAGNYPGDRATISITGPFTFEPGEKQSVDIAYVYARDFDLNDEKQAIDIMNQRIDTIRGRVENGEIIYLPEYSVGIAENPQTAFEVSVFPNPAGGNQIRVIAENSDEENLQLVITDLLGRNIIQEPIMGGEINTLDISQLQNGVYILSIHGKNSTVNRKLIIRR